MAIMDASFDIRDVTLALVMHSSIKFVSYIEKSRGGRSPSDGTRKKSWPAQLSYFFQNLQLWAPDIVGLNNC
jgi:hypothetical protein